MEWERVGDREKDLERDRKYTKKRWQRNEGGWAWEADRHSVRASLEATELKGASTTIGTDRPHVQGAAGSTCDRVL